MHDLIKAAFQKAEDFDMSQKNYEELIKQQKCEILKKEIAPFLELFKYTNQNYVYWWHSYQQHKEIFERMPKVDEIKKPYIEIVDYSIDFKLKAKVDNNMKFQYSMFDNNKEVFFEDFETFVSVFTHFIVKHAVNKKDQSKSM